MQLRHKYMGSANNTSNGQALGEASQDVRLFRLVIGQPVASANITVYNKAVAFNGDTANIAAKYTLPATLTTSYQFPYERVIDFGPEGLPLDGGNIQIDQALQLTAIFGVEGE